MWLEIKPQVIRNTVDYYILFDVFLHENFLLHYFA